MATLKSYSSGNLKLTDYLIATDLSTENVTRNFQVSEVVNAILKALTIGTVTSVSTTNSDFINFTGGPITTTGTLTTSLSATGTPSSATYLRGDGTWSEPGPTPTDIYTKYNGTDVTLDTTSWDFTGTGVTASSIDNNVTVDIPGLLASVESIIDGVGITAAGTVTTGPSTGDVTITNAGVYQTRAGGNVTLTGSATPLEYSSDVTINTRANAGKMVSVNPGQGIIVNNNVTNPLIDIDFTGNDNYIDAGESIQTISSDDFIAFQDLTASEVKTTKLNTIPFSALPEIVTSIDSGDQGKIKNTESPAYTNVWGVKEIVTLTIIEYNQLTPKDNNTLYLIVGAGTSYVVTYQPIYNITLTTGGSAPASAFSVTQTINGGPCASTCSITGITSTPYSFVTTITAINGYSISSGGSLTTSGTISGTATLTPTVSAVLAPPTGGNCVVTLQIINATGGSGGGSGAFPQNPANFTISGDTSGATTTVAQGTQYNFNTTASASGIYSFTSGPNYSGFSGIAPFSPTATINATISGDLNVVQSSNATLTVYNSQVTLVGGAVASNLSWAITSSTPGGFGALIGGTPGTTATWNVPQWSASQSGGSISFAFDPTTPWKDSAGAAVTWPGPAGNVLPSNGQSVAVDVYAQGILTFSPNVPAQTMTLAYVVSGITGSQYTLNPTSASATAAPGVSYNLGSNPTITPNSGYYWSVTPAAPSNIPDSFGNTNPMTGTMPATGGESKWNMGTGTLGSSIGTVSMTTSIGAGTPSAITYQVTFQDPGAQTKNLSLTGSGSTSNSAFQLSGSAINVTVTKQTNLSIAQAAGSIIWSVNGIQQGPTQNFFIGDTVNYTRSISGVVHGNTILVNIVEG